VPTYQGGTTGGAGTTKTDNSITYQLNKSVQKVVRAPGAVTRLSVSVMLDDDPTNPNPALRQSVQDAVNAAAGIDQTRGDVLTVTALAFNRDELLATQTALADAAQKEQLMGYLHLAALVLGPLLLLVALFFILSRGRKKTVAEAAAIAAEAIAEAAAPNVDDATGPVVAATAAMGKVIIDKPIARTRRRRTRRQIQQLVINPLPSQLIQTWMDEDRRNQSWHNTQPKLEGPPEGGRPHRHGRRDLRGVPKNFKETDIESLTPRPSAREAQRRDQVLVLEECYHMAIARDFITSGGVDHARDMPRACAGQDKANESPSAWRRRVARNGLASRATRSAQLAQFIGNEHPQTIALIPSHLQATHAAQTMTHLGPEVRTEFALRIATMDRTPPEVVERSKKSPKASSAPSSVATHLSRWHAVPVNMLTTVDRSTENRSSNTWTAPTLNWQPKSAS
jgi:hypothetical protein